jgi:uncharacterized coiled-coil protein SlyX
MSLHKRVTKLEAEVAELKVQMNFLLENFEERLTQAIDKVIGEGIEVEQTVESQIKELIDGDK